MYFTKMGESNSAFDIKFSLHKTKDDAIKYIIDFIIKLIENSSSDIGDIYDMYKNTIAFIQEKDYDAAIQSFLEYNDHMILTYNKIDFYNGSFNLTIDSKIMKYATFR